MNTKLALSTTILFAAILIFAGRNAEAKVAPCSLATSAEIGAALNTTFDGGNAPTPSTCEWREVTSGTAIFIVDVNTSNAAFYGNMKTEASQVGRAKPVSGLGDDAFFLTAGNGVETSLYVKKGGFAFQVMITGEKPLNEAQREANEQAIAAVIAKKL